MLCDSIKVKDPMKVGRFGLGFKSVFHVTGEITITYYRPLASGFSWKTANRKMSRDHGLAVTFAVCSSRLNRRKGFQR